MREVVAPPSGKCRRLGLRVQDASWKLFLRNPTSNVEHYRQRYQNAPLGQPSGRDLVAELALVKTSDTIGWVGFRDVVSVDGKPIQDRQDRLMALFRSGTPDFAESPPHRGRKRPLQLRAHAASHRRSRDSVAAIAASVTATATYGDFKRFGVSTSTTFKH